VLVLLMGPAVNGLEIVVFLSMDAYPGHSVINYVKQYVSMWLYLFT
jgi:hypothetical protein